MGNSQNRKTGKRQYLRYYTEVEKLTKKFLTSIFVLLFRIRGKEAKLVVAQFAPDGRH